MLVLLLFWSGDPGLTDHCRLHPPDLFQLLFQTLLSLKPLVLLLPDIEKFFFCSIMSGLLASPQKTTWWTFCSPVWGQSEEGYFLARGDRKEHGNYVDRRYALRSVWLLQLSHSLSSNEICAQLRPVSQSWMRQGSLVDMGHRVDVL